LAWFNFAEDKDQSQPLVSMLMKFRAL